MGVKNQIQLRRNITTYPLICLDPVPDPIEHHSALALLNFQISGDFCHLLPRFHTLIFFTPHPPT